MVIKQFLVNLEYDKDQVDYIMSWDKVGDSNGNGANIVDDRDRDNESTSDDGDIEDDNLC